MKEYKPNKAFKLSDSLSQTTDMLIWCIENIIVDIVS